MAGKYVALARKFIEHQRKLGPVPQDLADEYLALVHEEQAALDRAMKQRSKSNDALSKLEGAQRRGDGGAAERARRELSASMKIEQELTAVAIEATRRAEAAKGRLLAAIG